MTRVRFQDPQAEVSQDDTADVGSYTRDQDQPGLSGIRMTQAAVETEFRRRVEEYSEDSDDVRRRKSH